MFSKLFNPSNGKIPQTPAEWMTYMNEINKENRKDFDYTTFLDPNGNFDFLSLNKYIQDTVSQALAKENLPLENPYLPKRMEEKGRKDGTLALRESEKHNRR